MRYNSRRMLYLLIGLIVPATSTAANANAFNIACNLDDEQNVVSLGMHLLFTVDPDQSEASLVLADGASESNLPQRVTAFDSEHIEITIRGPAPQIDFGANDFMTLSIDRITGKLTSTLVAHFLSWPRYRGKSARAYYTCTKAEQKF